MSGYVGGAGSKSGVIGETEIDYEEGDWTPGTTGTGYQTATGTYTKIGRQVFCTFFITATSSDSSGDVTGLPFSIGSGSKYPSGGSIGYCGEGGSNSEEGKGYAVSLESTAGGNNFSFRGGKLQKHVSGGKSWKGGFTYNTD